MNQPFPAPVAVGREEIKRGLAAGSFALVDVREAHEFAAGHIPGALSMPLSAFDGDRLRDLGRRVVFVCAAGVRSNHALRMAQAEGLDINEHYPGGFRDWAGAGETIETGA